MRRSMLCALCVGVATMSSTLEAQRADSLITGAKVRVQRAAPVWTMVPGTYVTRDSSAFVIDEHHYPGARILIPMRDVISVDMVVRERSSGEAFRIGAGRGALVGLGASAVLITVGAISDSRTGGGTYISATTVAAVFSVLVTGATTLLGGAIGMANREEWKPVPFRPQGSP